MIYACDIHRRWRAWGEIMDDDDHVGRLATLRRAPALTITDLCTTMRAVEDALIPPVSAPGLCRDGLITSLHERITAALAPIARLLCAQSVLCWFTTPDGAWQIIGDIPEVCLPRARELVAAALADQRVRSHSSKRMGSFSIFPVALSAARGALTILRPQGQPLSKDEKAALSYLAQRVLDAVAHSLAWHAEHKAAYEWRRIFNALPVAMIVREADQRVVDYNDAALKLAANADAIRAAQRQGVPPPVPEWVTTLPHGKPITPGDIPSARAAREATLVQATQMEVATRDGAGHEIVLPVLATAVPLYNSARTLMRTVTIVHDISPTKRIEQMKDTFAQRVRHDVNSPLMSIQMAANVIKKRCEQIRRGELAADDALLAKLISLTTTISEGSRTIESVVIDLSNLDEVILGAPARMSLTDCVRECLQVFKNRFPDHHFTCAYDSGDTLLEGYWHKPHVESIISNLLENAVKYSPKQTTISMRLFADTYDGKPMAHIVVKDEGYGIDKNAQEAIFEKGARLNHKDEQGNLIPGTGEGLHYIKVLAMMYGGKPWVRSGGAQQGSEFHVRLPLAE
jgi:signal transduction histidine kinase